MRKNKFLSFIIKFYPFLFFIILYIFIFHKVFLNNLVPVPSDLLVSFFFPYNSGGWEGYNSWTTHKEFIAADVVRQLYPWRELAFDQLRSGVIPLWNPYAFSGTPLLANVQSAVFYPFNILFLFFSTKNAWIFYIMIQPILAFLFMFLFLSKIKLTKLAAFSGSLAFAFLSYTNIWFELGVVGHAGLWLPLSFWGIQTFLEKKNTLYYLISVLAISISFLAGHTQTSIYVLIFTVLYFFYFSKKIFPIKKVFLFLFGFLLTFAIAAAQIIPSFELMLNSARDNATSLQIFKHFQLPPINLIIFFAPDFFGNPATGNFWGKDYGEFMTYVGIVVFIFSCIAIFQRYRDEKVKFFLVSAVVALVFALPTPFSDLLTILNIPVLGTGIPSRVLYIVEVSFAILAAFGLDYFIRNQKIKFLPFILISFIYIFLWLTVFLTPILLPHSLVSKNILVVKRNLILPTLIFFLSICLLWLSMKKRRFLTLFIIFLIFLQAFEYLYFLNKFLPFGPPSYIFPNHPLIEKLKKVTFPNRVYGYESARLETNLTTQWRILSPEGYDPLYIKRYGELIAASGNGLLTNIIPRSDAILASNSPHEDSFAKRRLLNLLGVQYIVDKEDNPLEKQSTRMPKDRFDLIWFDYKWRLYRNKEAFPRAMIFYNIEIINNTKKLLERFFDKAFDYRNTLLLEENPEVKFSDKSYPSVPAKITYYGFDQLKISVTTKRNGLLFLSDVYYPGWNAYLDGRKIKILRANYAFRAVSVPSGNHTIIFRYEPLSFKIGLLISLFALSAWITIFILNITRSNIKIIKNEKD